jgi:hypothetical protein
MRRLNDVCVGQWKAEKAVSLNLHRYNVALDTVAVALYLEAWASANSNKLGLDESPGHDEMVAPVKVGGGTRSNESS